MQVGGSVEQGKSRNQADQAKKMVAMQMGNKNVVDF